MNNKSKSYLKSFDGIRTIALLSVLFYHLIQNVFVGGYLGVVIFFVLAGYLSMKKIISVGKIENNRTSNSISQFLKKLVKLYPPLIIMLGIVTIVIFLSFKSQFMNIENGLKGSILSLNNYFQIFSGSSYFESTGTLKPFTHIWALSLEIQFYFIFYIFFYGRYEDSKKKTWSLLFIIISILSYILSLVLIGYGYDFSRIYYGLFTRFYSFAIGISACLLSHKNNKKLNLNAKQTDILIAILLLFIIIPNFIFEANNFIFHFGFLAYTLISSFTLVLLAKSESYFSKLLSNSFTSFMTKRAYHIYLWHFPIIAIEDRYFANKDISSFKYYFIFLISLIIFTELSLIISKLIRKSTKSNMISSLALILICIVLFLVPYKEISENTEENKSLKEMKEKILENEAKQREELERESNSDTDMAESKDSNNQENTNKKDSNESTENNSGEINNNTENSKNENNSEEKEIETKPINPPSERTLKYIEWVNSLNDEHLYLNPEDYAKYHETKALLLGDSLASMSYHTLAIYMPKVKFDSEHSRQMKNASDAFDKYKNEDFGDYLILSLGTNGPVKHEDIDKVHKQLNGRKLILLNIVLPYKNEEETRNESIVSYTEKYDDVYLVDWHKAVKNRPNLFFDDKIHVGEKGAKIMGQIIIKKIIEIEKSKWQSI